VKTPTSIRGVSPRSPVLIGLDKLPIKAPYHSIIGGGYQSPEAIEELLRILRLHLGLKAEPMHKVAAAQ
jgi:hypothetical protein